MSESNPGAEGGFVLNCAFCDYGYSDPDNHSEELRRHIPTCANHPIAPVLERLKLAEDLLVQVEYHAEDSWRRALRGIEAFNRETGLPQGGLMVTVTMDGESLRVPGRVDSWEGLRGALGVEGDAGVAMRGCEGWVVLGKGHEDIPGEVVRWWEFEDGQEYKTVRRDPAGVEEDDDEDDDDPYGFRGKEWWRG